MATHELKTWPHYFQQVYKGEKSFELRRNDRNYQVGDTLVLKEWLPGKQEYTGLSVTVSVTSILEGFDGIEPGYCVMSIKQ